MTLLVACDASGEDLVASSESVVSSEQDQLDRATIAAQEEIWIATRPAAYAFEVETTCECVLAGTYAVTVVGQEVVGLESRDPDAERYRVYSAPTLDRSFAMLDEPLALAEDGEITTGRATASFDPEFGYPTTFAVEGSDGLPSYEVAIRDFAPADPSELDDLPALSLVLSNQSFDEPDVGLTVTVDDEVVVERSFAVEGQHNYFAYRIPLAAGDHQLVVRADTGALHERVVTIAEEDRYVYAGFWGGDPASPAAFSVSESDQPFGFG